MMGRSKKFYSPRRAGLFNISMTNKIVAANIIAFFIFLVIISLNSSLADYIFLKPSLILKAKSLWTIITSMFMHAGLLHLFVNMFSLFFIGNFLEKIIGRKRFFWLYILSGIFSGLFFVFLSYFFGNTYFGVKIFGAPDVFAVGASGAIFALGGLLAVLTTKLKVYVFFVIPMQMWIAMIALLFVLWAASIGIGLPFGNTAHLGGLLIGLSYAFYLKKKYKQKTALISRYFSR